MPNYKETTISGSSYIRAHRVIINNPYQGIPTISFQEEEVLNVNGQVIQQQKESVNESLTDPSASFPLVDPTTGDSLGEATYGQIYVLLHSLYLHLAAKRDAAV